MKFNSSIKHAMIGASALGMLALAPAASAEIGACLITKTDTNPFFVKMKEGALAGAKANGIKLQTFAGKIDGDVETQVAAVETCIASGAKGILITPTDSRALAPVVTWVGALAERFRLVDGAELAWYESTPGAERGFCRRCGTTLFFRSVRWPDEMHVVRTAFDGDIDREPQMHVHYASHAPWFDPGDALPRHAETGHDDPG